MKLGYTIIYVNDVTETLAFYQRAFGIAQKMLHEGGDYGELDTGETTLAFSALALIETMGHSPKVANPNAPVFEIALTTENVVAAVEKAVVEGAKLVSAAQEMPWGQTVAYVHDINGCLVEICSPI